MKLNDRFFAVETVENIRTRIGDVVSTRAQIWELLDTVYPSIIYPDHINDLLNQINGMIIEMNRHLRSAYSWPFDSAMTRSTVFVIGVAVEHLARIAINLIAKTESAIRVEQRKED